MQEFFHERYHRSVYTSLVISPKFRFTWREKPSKKPSEFPKKLLHACVLYPYRKFAYIWLIYVHLRTRGSTQLYCYLAWRKCPLPPQEAQHPVPEQSAPTWLQVPMGRDTTWRVSPLPAWPEDPFETLPCLKWIRSAILHRRRRESLG